MTLKPGQNGDAARFWLAAVAITRWYAMERPNPGSHSDKRCLATRRPEFR